MSKTKERVLPFIQFFFLGCFMGWLWEVIVYWFSHGASPGLLTILMELRGVLHGPWVPIYGVGCILMLIFRYRVGESKMKFFLFSAAACGIVEYLTSWFLEVIFHAKWWDYSDQLLNLNGRICVTGVFFFGIAGMMVVYFVEPVFQKQIGRMPALVRTVACMVLVLLFVFDIAMSLVSPNIGMGVSLLK